MVIFGDFILHNLYGDTITVTMTYGSERSYTEIEFEQDILPNDRGKFSPKWGEGNEEDFFVKALLIESDDGAFYYDNGYLDASSEVVVVNVYSNGRGGFVVS